MEKPYFFQVVLCSEKIIGFHIISNINRLARKVANILTLWVDPNFRRRGIAKKLKENGMTWANQEGFPLIQTHVNIKNTKMLDLNKSLGFSSDTFLMKKNLGIANSQVGNENTYYMPTFYTERLILKAPMMSDAKYYQKCFADYEVIRNLSTAIPWPYPENGAEEYLKNIVIPMQGNDRWTWAIYLKLILRNL